MSGHDESAKALLDKVDSSLDSFEATLGLPSYEPNNEVHRYLKMKQDELRRLTPDEAGEAAYLLRQFSFYLQRSYNREISKVNLLDKQVRHTICSSIASYKAPSAEERRDLAIEGNEHARALQKLREFHQARADRIGFLSKAASDMAHSLEELAQTKRRQRT